MTDPLYDDVLADVGCEWVALEAETAGDEAKRLVYPTLLATFDRGLLAALDGVVEDPKVLWGDRETEAWLRHRPGELE